MSGIEDGPARRVVVVGASLAGLRAAETLRAEGYAYETVVVGDECHAPYDRPPLSKEILTGGMSVDQLTLTHDTDLDVTWRLGEAAVSLDPVRQVVRLSGGDELSYDGLVLATGSRARRLPVFEASESLHVIRRIEDAVRLRSVLKPGLTLLVVGCGFVGVEVASSARYMGADVMVVGIDSPLSPAGPLVSATASRLLADHGVDLYSGTEVAAAESTGAGYRVMLSDDTILDADHVVVAVGAQPNLEWLAGSGLAIDDGVVCEDTLHVAGYPNIVAAGDITRWSHRLFGASLRVEHWSNAVEQGRAAARNLLAGEDAAPFAGIPSFWSDHFGSRLQSVGALCLATQFEVVEGDPEAGRFAADGYAGEHFVGGVAYGMPRAMAKARIRLAQLAKERSVALVEARGNDG